jgi:hypothetical protein
MEFVPFLVAILQEQKLCLKGRVPWIPLAWLYGMKERAVHYWIPLCPTYVSRTASRCALSKLRVIIRADKRG